MGNVDISEDEIDLIDYFKVLWKRRYLIVLGSALPALVVGLAFSLLPRKYKLTYHYDIDLTKRRYEALLNRFYSAENLDMLTAKLEEEKVHGRSQRMIAASVDLDVPPSYFDTTAVQKRDAEYPPANHTLLTMTIMDRSRKDVEKISSIMRDNFERILPIYDVEQELSVAIADLRTKMADIEKERFGSELELEKKRRILERLKDLDAPSPAKTMNGLILHFDNVGDNSQYLPLAYQIQANISSIIDIEESLRTDQKMYDYYRDLLSLNERLFEGIKDKAASYYTIQQFHSFLTDVAVSYKDKQSIDYLNAYIRRTENAMSTNTPVVEKPAVYPVPKGTVKKSIVSLVAFLIIALFAAFLLEAVQRRQTPTS